MLRQIIKKPNLTQVKSLSSKLHSKASASTFSSLHQSSRLWYYGLGLTLTVAGVATLYNTIPKIQLDNETEDPIKLQALQVKHLRDTVKVYLWGDNTNLIVAPNEVRIEFFKLPVSLSFFDNCALRDLKLGKTSAAAVDVNGDVYQWGLGYFGPNAEDYTPKKTLKGWNIVKVELTDDKIICLTQNGHLFLMPSDNSKLYTLPKKERFSTWLGQSTSPDKNYCIELKVPGLKWGENIVELESGNHHIAIITSNGRLLTLATDPEGTQFGQLGVQSGEVYKFYEPEFLDKTLKFEKLAIGSNHTIVASSSHRLFGFGMNDLGQLGLGDFKQSTSIIREPVELPNLNAQIESLHLGGDTSFINAGNQILSFGNGQFGQLGNGQFVHFKPNATQVTQLSNKFYWDESKNEKVGLKFSQISAGNTHAFFVLDSLPGNGNAWGRSVYALGRNHCGQLGNDKRSNASSPITLPPILPASIPASAQGSIHLQLPYSAKLNTRTPDTDKLYGKNVSGIMESGFNNSAIYFRLDSV
ncbi:RCC1/BLIP-II protein [Conidiobolus coronatus NRRL 28638]|uniref:RCC1/BLIP-II protein n=1 Tax=Conidiobolus coronatus (strain ATCC 28846 / CBS 209.66 / NRRL 28638) TaxID=796925 RepID=A0A137NQF0_CONC2|nr:RCC1/BLIP-II protein [Conidiobolus coronatus NRRL 28638]|eukprot:KXN64993.1 RCC1/BLIP-II protein [Conidiobolus coronatus NRRL 28638]